MNAAGMSPWVLFRAFVAAALVVSLLVGAISAYFAPKGLRMLRDWLTEVRANVVSSIVQPGRFTTIENGVTIHIRERRPNGQLAGIFLDDRRNPNERITVLSEIGELLDNESGTYLVLQKGIVQRQETGQRDPAMVVFDRYAFDLSQFAGGAQSAKYSIRERYLWQLLFPDPKDQFYVEQPGQFRAELHDRLMAPLYPLAFVVIAYAYLGAPRTTRQSRTLSMLGAIGGVALLRLIGFASTVFGAAVPWMLALQYLTLAAAIGAGLYVIRRGLILSRPPSLPTGSLRSPSAWADVSLRRDVTTMPIIAGTLARYFGLRFLNAVLVVFAGIFALVALIDYIELMRRAGDIPNVSAALVAKTSFYRVPQVVERILPFCVLIGAMSCYLNLSRRLELVVARSAGMSAWQFVMPAIVAAFVFGIIATAIYNPISATTAGALEAL